MKNETKKNLIFALGIFIIAIVYTYVRYPMLTFENSVKGWNSDHAIFVMMGEDIKNLVNFPFYYWGGNYLGPLNNTAMVLTQYILNLLSIKQAAILQPEVMYSISPFAASLTCLWLFFLGTVFWGIAFRRFFNLYESLLACLLLSVGGGLFMRTSLRPLAPEVAYLLGAIIIWRGALLIESNTKKNQLFFGFIFGFSWWMNQITVFTLAPVFFYFISQNQYFQELRIRPHILSRLLLKEDAMGISSIHKGLKGFLYFLYALALINFSLGFLIALIGGVNDHFLGVRVKIHNGVSPMKTSILIFVITQILLWFFKGKNAKGKIIGKLTFFLIGTAIGFGPVLIGRIFKLYKKGYTPHFKLVPIEHLREYWARLFSDFIPRLLAPNETFFIIPLFVMIIFPIAYSIYRNRQIVGNYLIAMPGKIDKVSILWAIPLFNFVYIFICERSRDQYAFRYAILSLPVIAIYFATLHRRIPIKLIATPLTIVACIIFANAQYKQGQKQISSYIMASSHKQKIKILLKSECEVFFSNYWNTYIYEYFLQHQKRFAVVRGQDRTPEKTAILKASSLKKCDLNEDTFEITEL